MSVFAAMNATNGTTGTGAAPAADAAPAPAGPPPFNSLQLVVDIDIALICIVGFFMLLLLPRAAIRFTHKREWDGLLLRSVDIEGPARARVSHRAGDQRAGGEFGYKHDYADKWGASTDASHTYVTSHAGLVPKVYPANGPEPNVPTHMRGWSTMFPSVAALLRKNVTSSLTLGKTIIVLGYFGLVLFAALYMSDPLADPIRAGYLAISQVPVVIMFATKNNLVGWLIGFGYERLNFIHRFAGRMMILAANVHAIGYFYAWATTGTFWEKIVLPPFTWGLVALVCADLLFLLSLEFVRTRFYNSIFIPSHIAAVIVMLIAVCNHYPVTIPFVLASVGIYGFDRVMRFIKMRVAMAHLRPLPDLGVTRVEIPYVNAGWRAGQHVRLRVLSWRMGWRGWAESHPFTIASVSRSASGEGLVLMVKKAGDWTNKLYDLGQRADYGEANGLDSSVQVIVEGPYGGPGHAIFSAFSGALFVAGGSGITFALAAVQDLMKKDLEARSRVRAMELVWSVQDPSQLTPLVPLFQSLLAQSYDAYANLRISVFYTRAPTSDDALKRFGNLPPGLTLSPARPRIGRILEGVVDRSAALFTGRRERARGEGGLTGVIVGVCGPAGIGLSVRQAVAQFDSDRASKVGGIEIHEEAFGW